MNALILKNGETVKVVGECSHCRGIVLKCNATLIHSCVPFRRKGVSK